MENSVRFCFALTPRMQAFIDLRDGLQCLEYARKNHDAYGWLQAVTDVRSSLSGGAGRKPAIPEMLALLKSMRIHLNDLAKAHPDYHDKIMLACDSLKENKETIRQCSPAIFDFLSDDGLLKAWSNAVQKQDWLGYKLSFPQVLPILWESLKIQDVLSQYLQNLCAVMIQIDIMLNDFVPWVEKVAQEGNAQIIPPRGETYGLLIVGIASEWVQKGIVPEFSGNRLAIRMRFQAWQVGKAQRVVENDIPYRMMLVPIT